MYHFNTFIVLLCVNKEIIIIIIVIIIIIIIIIIRVLHDFNGFGDLNFDVGHV